MPRIDATKLLIEKLVSFEQKLDKVRTEDLPAIHTAMGVLKVQVEERTGKKATLITSIGGVIAVLTSIGSAVAVAMLTK